MALQTVETQEVPIDALRAAVTRVLDGQTPGEWVSLGQICDRVEGILGAVVSHAEVADEVAWLTGRDEDAEFERVRESVA